MPFTIICKQCGQTYESRYSGKKYCTQACYHSSDDFKAMMRASNERRQEAARIKAGLGPKDLPSIVCLNCGTIRFIKPRQKGVKYCSQKCYREYMALRFDRFIASPESLALPQNYDEFLTGDELHCLIEGCGWSGLQLSCHMNFTHGIKKDKFKEMAGFNMKTGVITAEYSQRLSENRKTGMFDAEYMARLRDRQRDRQPGLEPQARPSLRLEGREHQKKAQALGREQRSYDRQCVGCKTFFSTPEVAKKWCTIECRDRHHREDLKRQYHDKTFEVVCTTCKKTFLGTRFQKQRSDEGKPLACTFSCRQRRAGSIARGVWQGD